MFTIIGSGFGLYGYLPALVEGCEQSIILPKRYQKRLNQRPELTNYKDSIHWVSNDEKALQQAEGVVFSVRPSDQMRYIPNCLTLPNIKKIILEKPLAPDPSLSSSIFNNLIASKKTFRIGYNFRYTLWGKMLLNKIHSMNAKGTITFNWSFNAHHFIHNLKNWKRYHSLGGGAIRFYGVHIIALLAEIGYSNIISSKSYGQASDEPDRWIASFTGNRLPNCEVIIDSNSQLKQFKVDYKPYLSDNDSTLFTKLENPFDISCITPKELPNEDPRIPVLKSLSRSLWEDETDQYKWYGIAINLWSLIESKTQFKTI